MKTSFDGLRTLATATALLVGAFATAAPLAAQMCFRGQPLPRCNSFWITDFSIGPGLQERASNYFMWELGGMVNRGNRLAFGGTVSLALLGEVSNVQFALKPRLRRWLGSRFALDVSPGLVVKPALGFTGDVTLEFADLLGVTTKLDVYRRARRGGNVAAYVGVKAASGAAAITGILAVVLGIVGAYVAAGG